MDKRLHDVVFTEVMNRYNRYFISIIRLKFQDKEEVKDVFQDFSMFLYNQIGKFYPLSPDLFDTKSWLRTVAKNFCLSELRKKNASRKVKLVEESKTTLIRLNYTEHSDNKENLYDLKNKKSLDNGINELLKFITKREILILKMKYYYNKPSTFICKKMNETHVDVLISRIKEKLKKKSGIKNVAHFVRIYNVEI